MIACMHRGRRIRRTRSGAGFTLVELLASLVILSVGILGVGRLMIFSQRHAYHGRSETSAVTLAEEIREKILSESFNDLVSIFDGVDTTMPATVTLPCSPWATHLAAQLGPSGSGRISVLEPGEDADIVAGMVTVLVEVSWDQDGVTKTVPVRFSISRMGL
ncbi:MAG: prepilin-type N-terminal cleavage/methylation domain-containing protein [Candidatus Eisenbacteria bacterium]